VGFVESIMSDRAVETELVAEFRDWVEVTLHVPSTNPDSTQLPVGAVAVKLQDMSVDPAFVAVTVTSAFVTNPDSDTAGEVVDVRKSVEL
jgi:hypothetical protein